MSTEQVWADIEKAYSLDQAHLESSCAQTQKNTTAAVLAMQASLLAGLLAKSSDYSNTAAQSAGGGSSQNPTT